MEKILKIIKQVKISILKSKKYKNRQKQQSGSNSQNLQAGGNIYITGLTSADVVSLIKIETKEIFKQNALVLKEEAYEELLKRSDEILDIFLKKIEEKNPDIILNMRNPGMQYSLYNAQIEYAKTGDKDLSDVLIDILVDRAQIPNRNLKQIVLDESLNIVSKLTNNQMDTLTICFLIKDAIHHSIKNLEELDSFLKVYLKPFINQLSKEKSLFQHLSYCSCSTIQDMTFCGIETTFQIRYRGLFSKGFTIEDYNLNVSIEDHYKNYITPCLHNNKEYQIKYINENVLEADLEENNIPTEIRNKIKLYFNNTTLELKEIKEYLEKRFDFMPTLFDIWYNSSLKSMSLTSVGIAIAQANFRRKTGITIDLGEWIKN